MTCVPCAVLGCARRNLRRFRCTAGPVTHNRTPPSATRLGPSFLWVILLVLLVPRHAAAQTDFQVWSNVTFNWVKSPRVAYGLDFEPKVLVTVPPGDSRWSSVDAIPSVDYVAKHWLDLTGEFDAGYTKQTNDENSLELAPRVGARIHLLSREHRLVARRVEELLLQHGQTGLVHVALPQPPGGPVPAQPPENNR